jgi:DNA-binding response OmpR family regulator
MSVNPRILIVEDDQDLNHYLTQFLKDNGYLIDSFEKGTTALNKIDKIKPDLVLLDLNLPDVKGQDLCQEIKQIYPDIKVIILTAKSETNDIVKGFNLGADDYLTKPFSSEELLARIKTRLKQTNNQILKLENLELNTKNMEVKRDGELIDLTQTEYNLLVYLLKNKNQVLTREMILSNVWEYEPDTNSRVVDVYIGYLRDKIDEDYSPDLIHSVRGFGYIMKSKK